MVCYAWKGRIRDGQLAEYRRRHDALWPEMKQVLDAAGIRDGELLFGYYECAQGIAHAAAVQAASPIVAKWNEYIADILDLAIQSDGAQAGWPQPGVFLRRRIGSCPSSRQYTKPNRLVVHHTAGLVVISQALGLIQEYSPH